MEKIFKKKKAKEKVEIATAPEEDESPGEMKHAGDMEDNADVPQMEDRVEVREVPVCLSQAQVNNMIIDNNIMLKELLSREG